MYKIERIPSKHRVVIEFDRFEDHDRAKFLDDLQAAAFAVRSKARHFDILADFTRSVVMPQDIAKDSISLSDWLIKNGLRRSANITQSMTQRMQIASVTKQNAHFGHFSTRAEGEHWLER